MEAGAGDVYVAAATVERRQCAGSGATVPVIYKELPFMACLHVQGEREGHALQTTALVHEMHFVAGDASMMRRILVDYSRRHRATKRGGAALHVRLYDALTLTLRREVLDSAPDELQKFGYQLAVSARGPLSAHPRRGIRKSTAPNVIDERKCRSVEIRLFPGLSAREIAAVLNTTEATVRRDWTIAKAWLYRYLEANADV